MGLCDRVAIIRTDPNFFLPPALRVLWRSDWGRPLGGTSAYILSHTKWVKPPASVVGFVMLVLTGRKLEEIYSTTSYCYSNNLVTLKLS